MHTLIIGLTKPDSLYVSLAEVQSNGGRDNASYEVTSPESLYVLGSINIQNRPFKKTDWDRISRVSTKFKEKHRQTPPQSLTTPKTVLDSKKNLTIVSFVGFDYTRRFD